ncbi:hypothetical protein [Halanaerobium hydrogeniformans]|uniref:PD-(D/E)XK nuclease superfamily protein n=1 Tax=Halanaerobium hydrogeniformans TaxID=656519 RepID=E4RMF7_HALHG|nr:hypothetical protein [Halanaerobium hydrogeniformans]ADQ14488.1 hypothetical protein Halsa_1049 [Halanaerobium hydrogeniformans]
MKKIYLHNLLYTTEIFISYIYSLINRVEPQDEIHFKTQQSGKDLTRPDMVGVNEKQEEILIIESKFWAGLTENQPIAYLKRLEESNYSGVKILLFICPEKRINSLWSELKRKCNNEFSVLKNKNSEYYNFDVKEELTITITSWDKIINIIRQELVTNNLDILLSDINQLDGLCSRMDEEAFLPLKEKDVGVDIAKRIYGYIQLIDKFTDKLKIKLNVNTDGLKCRHFREGYKQYLMINDQWGVSLEFNLEYWIKKAETPFWIGIKDSNWNYAPEIKDELLAIKKIDINQVFIGKYDFTYIPIFLPFGVSEDVVVNNVIDFIDEIFVRLSFSKS